MPFQQNEFHDACKGLDAMSPDLIAMLTPRIYPEMPRGGQYYSAKDPAYLLAFMSHFARQDDRKGYALQQLTLAGVGLTERWASYQCPTVWLSEQITRAISMTTPPLELKWREMPLPFEALCFMPPKGTLVHATHGDARCVIFARLRATEAGRRSTILDGKTVFQSGDEFVFFVPTEGGVEFVWNLGNESESVDLQAIDKHIADFSVADADGGWRHNPDPAFVDCNQEDKNFEKRAMLLTFGAILLMLDRPELITPSKLLKRVAKKGLAPKEFWTPNILGERYRLPSQRESLGGTHASPHPHWRRGHWREQPHGVGRSLRKLKWIEPYMTGLDDVAA